MRILLVLAAMSLGGLFIGCGTNNGIGACTAAVATPMTASDGGSVTCQCQGPCGCFYNDGGRCPQ